MAACWDCPGVASLKHCYLTEAIPEQSKACPQITRYSLRLQVLNETP